MDVPAATNAHRLRKMEQDQIHRRVLYEGLAAGATFTAGVGALSLLAQRYVPFYQRQTLPIKLFIVMAAGTGAFFTQTDRAAMREDRRFALKYSVSSKEEAGEFFKESTGYTGSLALSKLDWDEIKRTLLARRFEFVGYTWLSTVSVTLAYNFTRPDVSWINKLVNARLTAQVAALAGIGAAVALAATVPKEEKKVDKYFERVMRQGEADQKASA